MKTEFRRKAIYTKVCWVLKSDINTGLVTMKGILVIMVIELLML